MSRAIDLSHVGCPEHTNFGCQLFRLALKADASNLARIASGFPVEAEMVRMYHGDCSYTPGGEVDYATLERRAIKEVASRDQCFCNRQPCVCDNEASDE